MIAIDASAILAILLEEPDGLAFESTVVAAGGGLISPVNYWEVMVRAASAKGSVGRDAAQALLEALQVEIAPTTAEQAHIAVEAFAKFGRGARARLNLGDCFAYALAAVEGEGLLFKGDDFPHTDVICALNR